MASVWKDYHNRTCLMTERSEKEVRLVMSTTTGVIVYQIDKKKFMHDFSELVDYDPEKAARIYMKWAQLVGISDEALDELGKVLNKEELAMAKKNLPAAKMSEKAVLNAKTKKAKGGTAKKSSVGDKKPRNPQEPRHSASRMFQDLISEGRLTDDQIFSKVQSEFNLGDEKRKYVAWYRNFLKKKGVVVPDAVK